MISDIFNWLFNNYNFLYTPIEKIKGELESRKNIKIDEHKLLDTLKITPELVSLLNEQHLIFFRQIAAPLHETFEFLDLARKLELKPLILEYGHDKFVSTGNTFKKSLGKLPVYKFTSKSGVDVYENHTLVDFNSFVGKRLDEVETVKGERLIDLQHELFSYLYGSNLSQITIDGSNWFGQFDFDATKYYYNFLALFIKHNVLAEIFLTSGDEKRLTKSIVTPAFRKIKKEFGLKPIILNYLPKNEQERLYWTCYPSKTRDFLLKKGYI